MGFYAFFIAIYPMLYLPNNNNNNVSGEQNSTKDKMTSTNDLMPANKIIKNASSECQYFFTKQIIENSYFD